MAEPAPVLPPRTIIAPHTLAEHPGAGLGLGVSEWASRAERRLLLPPASCV